MTSVVFQVQSGMQNAQVAFAISHARSLANMIGLPALLRSAPQTVIEPLGYVIENLRPFDIPVLVLDFWQNR